MANQNAAQNLSNEDRAKGGQNSNRSGQNAGNFANDTEKAKRAGHEGGSH